MEFDVLLPTIVFLIVAMAVFLFPRVKDKISATFEENKFSARDAVLMVVLIAIMGTVLAFMPAQAIQVLYISSFSYMLFSFTYMTLKRWYIAILPPLVFIVFYLVYWGNILTLYWVNILIFNLFAAVFAVIATVQLGTIFSWKTTLVFAVFLTVMDVIQVFVTRFMVELATKTIELRLPVFIMLPTYPAEREIVLGLGDLFLSGLLSIQTALKYGQKAGISTAVTISVAVFLFEVIFFNDAPFSFFPATVVVISGWLAGMGIIRLVPSKPAEKSSETESC